MARGGCGGREDLILGNRMNLTMIEFRGDEMVNFDPEKTEIIFFDLEFYVPVEDRNKKGASLLANPCKDKHYLLGGVFAKYKPLKKDEIVYTHFWIWKDKDEKSVLKGINHYIQSSWAPLEDKDPQQADLIFCGVGISRFDVPTLFIRSCVQKIAPEEKLFECYFKTKQLDFSNIAIPFFKKDKVMYPKSINQIFDKLSIPKRKDSGMKVWEMYDEKKYPDIECRTEGEVRDCVELYRILLERIQYIEQ